MCTDLINPLIIFQYDDNNSGNNDGNNSNNDNKDKKNGELAGVYWPIKYLLSSFIGNDDHNNGNNDGNYNNNDFKNKETEI